MNTARSFLNRQKSYSKINTLHINKHISLGKYCIQLNYNLCDRYLLADTWKIALCCTNSIRVDSNTHICKGVNHNKSKIDTVYWSLYPYCKTPTSCGIKILNRWNIFIINKHTYSKIKYKKNRTWNVHHIYSISY